MLFSWEFGRVDIQKRQEGCLTLFNAHSLRKVLLYSLFEAGHGFLDAPVGHFERVDGRVHLDAAF